MKIRNLATYTIYLFWPMGGFLSSLNRFKSIFGYICFTLFGIFINLNMKIRVQDDIARYIGGYNYQLLGVSSTGDKDFYYSLSSYLFGLFNLPAIYIFIFWSIVYYTGFYLCIRLLLNHTQRNTFSIFLFICALFFIPIMNFSTLRYFTGSFYLIYYLIKIETEDWNLGKTLPLWIAPFMHFMHLPVVLIYYIYRIAKPKIRNLFILFIATLLLSFIDYSSVINSLGFYEDSIYLNSQYLNSIEASYKLGKYLYFPLLLSLWVMVFIQYFKRNQLNENNLKLLRLALFSMIVYNLVAPSIDFYGRFRRISEWLIAFSAMSYFQKTKDRSYIFFVFAFPICFILSNWDFLFVSGPEMFQYTEILTSNFFKAFNHLSQQIANL